MPLRNYIDKFSQDQDNLSIRERIEIGRPYLFDFDYPYPDADFKKVFETDFIRNFYMKEIGFETEEYFKLRLENWLRINMGYYSDLIKSTNIQFNPLENSRQDLKGHSSKDHTAHGTFDRDINGQSESNTDQRSQNQGDSFNRRIESDNPDSRLALTTQQGEGVIEYASELGEYTDLDHQKGQNHSDSNSQGQEITNSSTDNQINDIEDYTSLRVGKVGSVSYSELIQEYRNQLIRVEKMAFDEMTVLFMLLYG